MMLIKGYRSQPTNDQPKIFVPMNAYYPKLNNPTNFSSS